MNVSIPRLLVLLSISSSLAGCLSQVQKDYPMTIAPKATQWTQRIGTGNTQPPNIRSSALIGVYISHHLISEIVFHSALAGVSAQEAFLSESSQEQEQSFALLETMGAILQVDVPDMLNRSDIRSNAFDTYITNLQNIGKRMNDEVTSADTELEALNATRRAQRSDAAASQSIINRAIRNSDFATASDAQKTLIEQDGKLAVTEGQIDRVRSIKNLMENMIKIAEKRLSLMTANRAAILAGVKVTDLPGAEDLGILEQGRTFRQSGKSIFDPETLQ